MSTEANNQQMNETADAFVFGLLNEQDAAKLRARAASDPAWREALEQARGRRELLESLPAAEPSDALIRAALNAAETTDAHQSRRHRRRRTLSRWIGGVIAAALLMVGGTHAWIAAWKPPSVAVELFAQREVRPGSRASMRVVVNDPATAAPSRGERVKISLEGESTGRTVLASFTTDVNGTASPSFEYPDWAPGTYTLRVEVDGQEHIVRDVTLTRERRVMLSTDKPQYQPGQTIRIRTLALNRATGKPASGESVVFTVVDPRGNTIFKKSTTSGDFGIGAADCELASEITQGPYTIRADVGGTVSSRTVEVKKYVLPKFKVGVELDANYYKPGSKVKGTVDAQYFFGKHVKGVAQVVLRPLGVAAEEIAVPPLTLGADGRAEFVATLPKKLFGREQDGGDARIEIVVTVRDSAGQEVSRVLSRAVSASGVKLEVVPECEKFVVGLAQRIHVLVTAPDGSPLAASVGLGKGQGVPTSDRGLATVEWTPGSDQETLEVWATAAGSTVRRKVTFNSARTGFVLRTDAGAYESGATVALTALGGGIEPVFVDLIKDGQTIATHVMEMKDGAGALAIDLPAEAAGAMIIEAYRLGHAGLPIRTSRAIFVRPASALKVAVGVDRAEHRPGENAALSFTLTGADGKPARGAVSLAVVDEAALNVMTERPGMERTFFMLEDEILKPAAVAYGLDPLAPGVASDPSSREFFGAVLSRASERGADFTTGPAAGISGWDRNSIWSSLESGANGAQMKDFQPRYAGGRALLASSGEEAERRFRAARHRALDRVGLAWFITVCGSIIGGCIVLGMYTRRALAVVLVIFVAVGGLTLLLLPALGKARASAEGMRRGGMDPAPAEAFVPGVAGDMFFGVAPAADMSEVRSLSVSRPAAGPVELEPTRVREWFPETLVWAPEIITDDAGRATIDFALADSITNWKALGGAVDARGGMGSFDADLRVFQPFFVDVNAPVALVQKDTIDLPLVIYNYLETPQRVKVLAEAGPWCEMLVQPDFEVDLAPGEVRSVALRMRALTIGTHQLTVTASAGQMSDAIRKSIEVVPDGVPVERVVSGEVDGALEAQVSTPAGAIEGSERLFVRIFPTTFSQVIGGLEGILAMPHGCFEQTSSTTYPNVLALDYMRTTKKSAPEIEAKARQFIHLGYQRLISFEVGGGGFDWFGRPPANTVLTAYGLMEFEDMARVHDVDAALIDRTRAWLLARRAPDGTWAADPHMLNDGLAGNVNRGGDLTLSTTAYVAWSVFGTGRATDQAGVTLDWILGHEPTTIDNAHTLALVCNAVRAIEPGKAAPYLRRLVELAQRSPDGKTASWSMPEGATTGFHGQGDSGRVETTALAALALLGAGDEPALCRAALSWIVANKDQNGAWHSTQATVLALKALLAGTGKSLGGDGARELRVLVDGAEAARISIPADQADVVRFIDLSERFARSAKVVRIEDAGKSACAAQIVARAFVPRPDSPADDTASLAVRVTYDKSELKVGDTLKATAEVRNRAPRGVAMVMVDLPVPAGFAPDLEAFEALVAKQTIERYEVTARSVIVYLSGVPAGGAARFGYTLRATMPVDVTAPGAAAWEYYNPANRAVGKAGKLKSI